MVIKMEKKMSKLLKGDILERMQRLDEHVSLEFNGVGRFQVVIVGSGALVVRGYLARATADIDILGADNRLYSLMELYDMNGDVNAFMDHFAYNYEDRLDPLISGLIIDFYTASLEDIVIAKLCSNRPDDLTDIELVAGLVNWEMLEKLAYDEDELKRNILSERRYMDFKASYKVFEERFRT